MMESLEKLEQKIIKNHDAARKAVRRAVKAKLYLIAFIHRNRMDVYKDLLVDIQRIKGGRE